jgi:hypothetical protein
VDCSFSDILIKGASALGKRVSDRPVRRIAELPSEKESSETTGVQPPLFPTTKEGEVGPQAAGGIGDAPGAERTDLPPQEK